SRPAHQRSALGYGSKVRRADRPHGRIVRSDTGIFLSADGGCEAEDLVFFEIGASSRNRRYKPTF
ncbi:MAG TPA: hypothetical protein VFE64_04375, partial [Devosia sp.]|nr:hypothetical protein [Devosia sp.]